MRPRLLLILLEAPLCHGFRPRGGRGVPMPAAPAAAAIALPQRTPRSSSSSSSVFQGLPGPLSFGRAGRSSVALSSSFFRDLLDRAFENDPTISRTDTRKGQVEYGSGEDDDDQDDSLSSMRQRALTETQQKWRELASQQMQQLPLTVASTIVTMDLYLTGVPNKDPSNDLFGSRVNISSRDRRVNQALPAEPTVPAIRIAFNDDRTCRCLSETPFTSANAAGEWKLSEGAPSSVGAAAAVRFRIPVLGYTRTVETKGTLQKVYWSAREDAVRETSTTYAIEPGWLYGEASLARSPSSISRKLRPGGGGTQAVRWGPGVLKVERTGGLLGAATTLVPCGAFAVTAVAAEGSNDEDAEEEEADAARQQ